MIFDDWFSCYIVRAVVPIYNNRSTLRCMQQPTTAATFKYIWRRACTLLYMHSAHSNHPPTSPSCQPMDGADGIAWRLLRSNFQRSPRCRSQKPKGCINEARAQHHGAPSFHEITWSSKRAAVLYYVMASGASWYRHRQTMATNTQVRSRRGGKHRVLQWRKQAVTAMMAGSQPGQNFWIQRRPQLFVLF